MERYLVRDGKKLKYGYTTGSCATGAALAAIRFLEDGIDADRVKILTPKGWTLELDVIDLERGDSWAVAGIKKYAGDDPDVTNGLIIYTKIERNKSGVIDFVAGEGVGIITKPGLQISQGEAAINPVPRKMIQSVLEPYVTLARGYTVTVFVPGGVETAKKTFNPRLGIMGGISIIGTSGIVEPMSEEALKESLLLDLKIKLASGISCIVFTPGNYGHDLGLTLGISEEQVVKTSNYIGFMLDRALELGVKQILWVGHIGKMVKVAAGVFQTHSSIADARMETLAAWAGVCDAPHKIIAQIMNCNTTEEAVHILKEHHLETVLERIAEQVSIKSTLRTHNEIKIGTIIFSTATEMITIDENGHQLLEVLSCERD